MANDDELILAEDTWLEIGQDAPPTEQQAMRRIEALLAQAREISDKYDVPFDFQLGEDVGNRAGWDSSDKDC